MNSEIEDSLKVEENEDGTLAVEYESKWTIPVEEDPITGELYITFPPEAIQKTGWKDNDTLKWIDNKDGSFTLRKV